MATKLWNTLAASCVTSLADLIFVGKKQVQNENKCGEGAAWMRGGNTVVVRIRHRAGALPLCQSLWASLLVLYCCHYV